MTINLRQSLLAGAAMGVAMLAFGSAPTQAACSVNTGGTPDTVLCVTDDAVGVDLNGSDPVSVVVGPGNPNNADPGAVLTITGDAANGEAFNIDTDDAGDTIDFSIITSVGPTPASAVDINSNGAQDAILLTTDNGNVTFLSEGNSTIDGGDDGLEIQITGNDNTATIVVNSLSNISSTGTDAGDAAIDLAGQDGTIGLTSGGTLTAEGDGARIRTEEGNVTAAFSGQIDAGAGGGDDGVDISTINDGNANINVTMNAGANIVGAGDHGLNLFSSDGAITTTVNSNFSNIGNNGLDLETGDGNGAIDATLNGNLSNIGEDGLHLVTDDGNMIARINGQVGTLANAVGDDGVQTSTSNNGNTRVVVGTTGDIFAEGSGISINHVGSDAGNDGTIDLDIAGGITKVDGGTALGAGVRILADDSVITLVTRGGGVIDNQETGALSAGIAILTDNQDNQAINLDIGDTITTAGGVGIAINPFGGDGMIDVTTLASDGTANTGASGGAIDAALDGILASTGAGNVTMAIGANITAGESAVRVLDGNVVNLTFGDANNTGVVVTGEGSVLSAVVNVEEADDDSSITNYATIRSTAATLAAQADDRAIDINSDDDNDDWIIDNYNTIIGYINGSNASDTVNNFSDESWIVAGDNVVNDFQGGDDTIENYGRIITAITADLEEDVFFSGVQQFNNGFPTMVGTGPNYGLLTMIDQTLGQDFVMDRTVTEGSDHVFAGGEFSKLGIDAFLGADPDTADFLEIRGDNTGATALIVNDINPGAGAFNPDGILFAHVDGDSPEGAFFLPNGPIDKGFFSYDILRVEGNSVDWYLVSAPNDRADELAAVITGAQTLWYESSGVWLDRTADLRRQIGTCAPADEAAMSANVGGTQVTPTADVAPECFYNRYGLWFRGFGGQFDRDEGVHYDQDLWGAEGGFDVVLDDDPSDGAFILGILGGYLGSKMDFDSTGDEAKFEGGSLGAYATYLYGGWFADLLFKANILDVDYETTFAGSDSDASTDALSLGVRLDTGYRFDTDGGFFIEPQGTIAYVHTEIDDYDLLNTDVDPQDGESVRGRLGLRLGGSWDSGSAIFEPFLVGSVWHEFEGDNEVDLTSGGSVTVTDELDSTWGEVGGGLNVFNADQSLSFFAKVDAQVGGDIESWSGKVGGRIAW
ncbi:autotransporter domain-containing protein [Taklimakanibacter deserti]|uniref:autotransporter domain-containing protein n=1 Tax=Taklimakanibacter deserti TaxID=2267839 RepID=UPI000E64F690